MKNVIKFLVCIIFVMVIVFSTGVNARAVSTGFSTSDMDSEQENIIIKNLNISLVSENGNSKAIECFDVNESGIIALGHDNGRQKSISIYDSEGNFKRGYSFRCDGSFGVEWDGDCLNIYLIRGNVLVAVDESANIIDIAWVEDTDENNDYMIDYIFATEKNVGNVKYSIRNNMGALNFVASSYSQLVKSTEGNEVILYNANDAQTVKTVVTLVGVILFACVAVFVLIKTCKGKKS